MDEEFPKTFSSNQVPPSETPKKSSSPLSSESHYPVTDTECGLGPDDPDSSSEDAEEQKEREKLMDYQAERTRIWLESQKAYEKLPQEQPSNRRPTLIPPNPPIVPGIRFKKKWKHQTFGCNVAGNSGKPSEDLTWENVADFNKRTGSKRGKVFIYRIVDVFDEDDFTLQNYEDIKLLRQVETTLEDYCETVYAQNKGQPLVLEILHKYAVFDEQLGKWIRSMLIDVVAEDDNGPLTTAIFRQLDYGGWFSISLDSETCPGEYVQVVPEAFFKFTFQGATASQCENPILNKRFPLKVLKEMKNGLVLGMIQDYIPSENDGDVPHVNVTILSVIKVPKRAHSSFNRRKSI